MSIVAFTVALGTKSIAQAQNLRATFKGIHPNIPFFIIDDALFPRFARQPRPGQPNEIVALRTMVGAFLSQCFDRVLYFDADIVILGPLDRLFGPEPVLLTNDSSDITYSLKNAPLVNVGVISAASPEFWSLWMMMVYSYVIPIVGIFFDQLSLRLLCMQKAFPFLLLPEREEKEYYNIGYREHPGEVRLEGDQLWKGDARIQLWHWAGETRKPTIEEGLPEPAQILALRRRAQGAGAGDYPEENKILRRLWIDRGGAFTAWLEAEFRVLATHTLDEFYFETKWPGLYMSNAPAAWDIERPLPKGLYRRLMPKANWYLYAKHEALLDPALTSSLDRPLGKEGWR